MVVRDLTTETQAHKQPRYCLESGDRLTAQEFERRYQAMPHLKKAELIEGVVYVASPVHVSVHAEPHSTLNGWLWMYAVQTPGVRVADNATVRLDPDNHLQPDVLAWVEHGLGGRVQTTPDDYLEGAPELVCEVAASSASIDRHTKMHVYRRNGVQEYLVWQVLDEIVEWFSLEEGVYVPIRPDKWGIVHSRVFPGLRLAVSALLGGDGRTVLAELQAGLQADEHRAFVEQLAARRRP